MTKRLRASEPGQLNSQPVPADEERIDWLVDFLQRDLTTLRPGERLDLHDDWAGLLAFHDPAIDLAAVTPPDGYAYALAKLKGAPDVEYFDALALEVQATLKAGVARLEAGQQWEPFKKPLIPVFEVDADRVVRRRYHGTYAAIMLASAVDLLVAWWPQLRRCKYSACGRLFRPKENRHVYHDPKCVKLAGWHRRPKAPRNYVQE